MNEYLSGSTLAMIIIFRSARTTADIIIVDILIVIILIIIIIIIIITIIIIRIGTNCTSMFPMVH
jgi:hypothetical protein